MNLLRRFITSRICLKYSFIRPKEPSLIVNCIRCCSLQQNQNRDSHRKSLYKTTEVKSLYKTKEVKRIRFYVLTRYIDYLKNYDKILEKNFPAAMKVYRVFMVGCKDFVKETKDYFKIIMFLSKPDNNLSKLLRRELELYHRMPKEMIQVAPVLIIFSIPLGPYIILPLAYTFPRYLLSSHFWTLQQRSEYRRLNLRDRLIHNRPIFRHLQSQLKFLKGHCLYKEWAIILGKLGSGTQPSVKEILKCKHLFAAEPYHLMYLSRNHVIHLLKLHELHRGWFKRTRLADKVRMYKEMDKAIMREGGVHNLPAEALRNCCYLRGLNPANATTEDMIDWLSQWIELSNNVDSSCFSLLLHAPILLAYNAPSNWMIIYEGRKL